MSGDIAALVQLLEQQTRSDPRQYALLSGVEITAEDLARIRTGQGVLAAAAEEASRLLAAALERHAELLASVRARYTNSGKAKTNEEALI